MENVSHFINICPTISIQVLNLNDFFFVDLILTFKWCYEHWWKFLHWYLGPLFMASKDKANIGNPKAEVVPQPQWTTLQESV